MLVSISTCGICGTDMHLLHSGMHLPHIAGHEISGFLQDGTPVAIEPLSIVVLVMSVSKESIIYVLLKSLIFLEQLQMEE